MRKLSSILLVIAGFAVALTIAGCGGGGMEAPGVDHHIAASYYDGGRWNDAEPRLDAPGLTGPAGHWDAEVVSGLMATQGGTVPVGTCTMYDKSNNVVERTGKDWELNGDYRVVGRNAHGDILAEAYIWANPDFGRYVIDAGYKVDYNDTFHAARRMPDGSLAGSAGHWGLMIVPTDGSVTDPFVGVVKVFDENDVEVVRTNIVYWDLDGHYVAKIFNLDGRVVYKVKIYANPGFTIG